MLKKRKDVHKQMSETFINAVFLTISGGLQDSYTYFLRGHVFANAQTGNIILMTSHLFKGSFINALHYLMPLCAFALGIFAAEVVHRKYKKAEKVHWRQLILLVEIIFLFIVGFMPNKMDIVANAAVSFVCAMQVQSFRKFSGNNYSSTMCIGNIRSGTEALCKYFHTKDKNILRNSLEYFTVIFMFAIGSGIGNLLIDIFGKYTIWFSCILLSISFCIMFNRK